MNSTPDCASTSSETVNRPDRDGWDWERLLQSGLPCQELPELAAPLTHLERLMMAMYDELHPPDGRVAKQESRLFRPADSPVDFEIFISGMHRQQYEDRCRKYVEAKRADCRLCFDQEALIYRDRISLCPDNTPFFPYHMLLRFVRPEMLDAGFERLEIPHARVGRVRKEHLECRPSFSSSDLVVMAQFAEDCPNYMVTQSMGGSGASIPEHIHAHTFLKSQTRFPLWDKSCFEAVPGTNAQLWVNSCITFGLLVRGDPWQTADVMMALRNQFGLDSNQYFRSDPGFGGLTGLYLPRTGRVPSAAELRAVDWKFGAFEVLALFDAKTRELFKSFGGEQAAQAIREVTVQDPALRRAMIDEAARALAGCRAGRER